MTNQQKIEALLVWLDNAFIYSGDSKAGHPLFLLTKTMNFDKLGDKLVKAIDPIK